jgi:hypothetical protein
VAAAQRWRGGSGSISGGGDCATARRWRWQQRASATLAEAWRRHSGGGSVSGGGGSAKRGGSAQHDSGSAAAVAVSAMVAAARQRDVGGSLAVVWRWRQREARRWRTARRRQRGGSSAEAAADSLAPSANAPTHTPSNATDAPTYASLSLVEDGGTDSTDGIVVVGSDGGARGDVHRGRQCATAADNDAADEDTADADANADADADGDNIVC